MDGIPTEREKAAVSDGAGSLTALLRVVAPLVRPAMLLVAAWQFRFPWNAFCLALVIMTQNSMKTLPLAALLFERPLMSEPGKLLASLTSIGAVPMVLYAVLQRRFVPGLMAGAVKG